MSVDARFIDVVVLATPETVRVELDVAGYSDGSAGFADIEGLSIARNASSPEPFVARIPFFAPFPEGGSLDIVARPFGAGGASGSELAAIFDRATSGPRFVPGDITSRVAQGEILVEVGFTGAVSLGRISLLGASAFDLREVGGSIGKAEAKAFARARNLTVRPRVTEGGRLVFRVPMLFDEPPPSGVLIIDVELVGPFGRRVVTSVVDETGDLSSDTLLGLSLSPSPVFFDQGFGQRIQLVATGDFVLSGDVDLSGSQSGIVYETSDPLVATVTSAGEVIAKADGAATITARLGSAIAVADVVVDASASLQSVTIDPAAPQIERVGGSTQLKLMGTVDPDLGIVGDERQVDLSLGALGTVWESANPSIVVVDSNGKMTSLAAGSASITATIDGFSDSVLVEAVDAPPTVTLNAPASVAAGTSFSVSASAVDDRSVASITFFVNDVPSATVTEAPFQVTLEAPSLAGQRIRVSARARDIASQDSDLVTAEVSIVPPVSTTGPPLTFTSPAASAGLVAGLPVALRVRTESGEPELARVSFTSNGGPIGEVTQPRAVTVGSGDEATVVAVYELLWAPPANLAGQSVILRAQSIDRVNRTSETPALPVRVNSDVDPVVSITAPAAGAQVTADYPVNVHGVVSDDTGVLGVLVRLLVNDIEVATGQFTAPAVSSSSYAGTASFSLSFPAPPVSTNPAQNQLAVALAVEDIGGNLVLKQLGTLTVVGNAPPIPVVVSPGPGFQLLAGKRATFAGSVSDDDPSPPSAVWLLDGVEVGANGGPPYTASVLIPASLAGRNDVPVALRARDASGLEATSPSILISVVPDTQAPTVSVLTPASGATLVAGQDLLISAAGFDNAGVVEVEYLVDGNVVHEDATPGQGAAAGQFTSTHLLSGAGLQAGTSLPIRVLARDAAGNVGYSKLIEVAVTEDSAPTVSSVSPPDDYPAEGAVLTAGRTIHVVVDASDDVHVDRVTLTVPGVGPIPERLLPPYTFEVTLPNTPGPLVLQATAHDTSTSTTAARTLEIVADTTAPFVAFDQPISGGTAWLTQDLLVKVLAHDNVALDLNPGSFTLEIDGDATDLIGTHHGTAGAYTEWRWTVPVYAATPAACQTGTNPGGFHYCDGVPFTLGVSVRDQAQHRGNATVTVVPRRDLPPAITVLSPSPGQPVVEGTPITLQYTASDDRELKDATPRTNMASSGGTVDLSGASLTSPRTFVIHAPPFGAEEPSIGVRVRDSRSQPSFKDIKLALRRDDLAPTALVLSPLVGPAGMEVPMGASFNFRVETTDNVRVSQVDFLIDGALQGQLGRISDAVEETTVEDPFQPGQVTVSRLVRSIFASNVSTTGLSTTEHQLIARARDAAGNVYDTQPVSFQIVATQDNQAPSVTLQLLGTPSSTSVVAGQTYTAKLVASDNVGVTNLTLSGSGALQLVDGQGVLTPIVLPIQPATSQNQNVSLTLVQLPPGQTAATLTLTARAQDAGGRSGEATLTRLIVADAGPSIAVSAPSDGATWTEERVETVTASVSDDVSVADTWALVSSAATLDLTASSVTVDVPAAAPVDPVHSVELTVGGSTLLASADVGALTLTKPASFSTASSPGTVRLELAPGEAPGETAQVTATYHYAVVPGQEGSAALASFLASTPGGVRSATLNADAVVDFSYPSAAMAVTGIDFTFAPTGGGEPVISAAHLRLAGTSVRSVSMQMKGEWVAVGDIAGNAPSAGQSTGHSGQLILPRGIAPSGGATVTAVVVDSGGHVASDTASIAVASDTDAPSVAITSPVTGSTVVAGRSFPVVVSASDNVGIAHVELFLNGLDAGSPTAVTSAQWTFEALLPQAQVGAPVAVFARAFDDVGNARDSSPVLIEAVPDAGPSIALQSLSSPVQTITQVEIATGYVRLLQGQPTTLTFTATDDAALAHLEVHYSRGDVTYSGAQNPEDPPGLTAQRSLSFTPPPGPNGQGSYVQIVARDDAGHSTTRTLYVEAKRAQAPVAAFVGLNATILEGSPSVPITVIAGDDTAIDDVALLFGGLVTEEIESGVPIAVDSFTPEGVAIAVDANIRAAAEGLPAPYNDVRRLKAYAGTIQLQPGLFSAGAEIVVGARVEDIEGNVTVLEETLDVDADAEGPIVEIITPRPDDDLIEGVGVRVELQASDDVFVDSIILYAGTDPFPTTPVATLGGFQTGDVDFSSGEAVTPVVSVLVPVPEVPEGMASITYYFRADAIDINGNFGCPEEPTEPPCLKPEFQTVSVDIVQDQPPSFAQILTPDDGDDVVAGSDVFVVVHAEDDVGVASVELFVGPVHDAYNSELLSSIESAPFTWSRTVPIGVQQETYWARVLDTAGQFALTPAVDVNVVEDEPPLVTISKPKPPASGNHTEVEGRAFEVQVGAADDVEVAKVELFVEGGVSGALYLTKTTAPWSFAVPLPYGSAGRTITLRARATDSAGAETSSTNALVDVIVDDEEPVISQLAPAEDSSHVEGAIIDVGAVVEDNIGVAYVTFAPRRVDFAGQTVDGYSPTPTTLPAPPFRFSLAVPAYSDCGQAVCNSVIIDITATDSSGNESTDHTNFTIGEDGPPVGQFTSAPGAIASRPYNVVVEASDPEGLGILHVALEAETPGGELVEVGRRYQAPYNFNIVAPEAEDPSWQLRAQIVDVAENLREISTTVEVVADAPPVLEIKSPDSENAYFEGDVVSVHVCATDVAGEPGNEVGGAITHVAFLIDGERVDVVTESNFNCTFSGGTGQSYIGSFFVPVGGTSRTFDLTAVATDDAGQESTASLVLGTVEDTVPPEVFVITPFAGELITAAVPMTLEGRAVDNSALAADSGQFQIGGQVLAGTAVTSELPAPDEGRYRITQPYTADPSLTGSSIQIQALATDEGENTGESPVSTFEVGAHQGSNKETAASLFGPTVDLKAMATRSDGLVAFIGDNLLNEADRVVFRTSSAEAPLGGGAAEASLQPVGAGVSPVTGTFTEGGFLLVTMAEEVPLGVIHHLVVVEPHETLPVTRGRVDLPGDRATGIATQGNLAFVATGSNGVAVIDIADPDAPRRVTTIPTVGDARDVLLDGERLYVAADTGGLRVMDATSPVLQQLSFLALPGLSTSLALSTDGLYVGAEGLHGTVSLVRTAGESPLLSALLRTGSKRPDRLQSGVFQTAAQGWLAAFVTDVTDQDGVYEKSILTLAQRTGTGITEIVRANLDQPSDVAIAAGHVLTNGQEAISPQGAGVGAFVVPGLVILETDPAPAEDQAPLYGRAADAGADEGPPFVVTFNRPPQNPGPGDVTLRAGDPVIGLEVPIESALASGRQISIHPGERLSPRTSYFLLLDAAITDGVNDLGRTYVLPFETIAEDSAPLLVEAIQPRTGSVEGGSSVLITVDSSSGASLVPGATVHFNGVEATSVVVAPDGASLTCMTPAGFEGAATVEVRNPNGVYDRILGGFFYLKALGITYVAPSTGPLAGGNTVEVVGSGFAPGMTVFFGAVDEGIDLQVLSDGRAEVIAPAHDFGYVDIRLVLADGTEVVLPQGYLYSKLQVSARVDRALPDEINPITKLPSGRPIAVSMVGDDVFVLSAAEYDSGETDILALYEEGQRGSITKVDVSNPELPGVNEKDAFDVPWEPRILLPVDDTLVVGSVASEYPFLDVVGEGEGSLTLYSVSNFPERLSAHQVRFVGTPAALAHVDDLLIVAARDGGLLVFSGFTLNGETFAPVLVSQKNRFFVEGLDRELAVIDVTADGAVAYATLEEIGIAYPKRWTATLSLLVPGLPILKTLPQAADRGAASSGWAAQVGGAISLWDTHAAGGPRLSTQIPTARGANRAVSDVAQSLTQALVLNSDSFRDPLTQYDVLLEVVTTERRDMLSATALSLYPARVAPGVATNGRTAVAAVQQNRSYDEIEVALTGLVVVDLPFLVVEGTVPPRGAVGVDPGANISVTFDRDLSPAAQSWITVRELDGSLAGVSVQGGVTESASTLQFAPATSLDDATLYEVRVSGVESPTAGDPVPMAGPYTFTFRTGIGTPIAPLAVTSIVPRQGPTAGGTPVTVTGSGFGNELSGLSVSLGGVPVTVGSVTPTSLTFSTPPGAAGANALRIERLGVGPRVVRMGAFVYQAPLTLSAVAPNRAPTTGGDEIVLHGTGFSPSGVEVRFGGTVAPSALVVGTDRILATTPDGEIGVVDVQVTNLDSGQSVTLNDAFTFDAAADRRLSLNTRAYDIAVVGTTWVVVAAGTQGLLIFDLGEDDGTVDGTDDRVQSITPLGGSVVSVAWGGDDRLFVGTTGPAELIELDLDDPTAPTIVSREPVASDGVYGLEVAGTRLLSADGTAGLSAWDVDHPPFHVMGQPLAASAQGVSSRSGVALVASGSRDASFRVVNGRVQLFSANGELAAVGEPLLLDSQRVRFYSDEFATVAAGDDGLVVLDVSDPAQLTVLAAIDVGGFASDVRIKGSLAYVAAGVAGVVVVDLSDLNQPEVLYAVNSDDGAGATAVAIMEDAAGSWVDGATVLTLRDLGNGQSAVDYGVPAPLIVASVSVAEGQTVAADHRPEVRLSHAIDMATVVGAVSLTENGTPIGVRVEAASSGNGFRVVPFDGTVDVDLPVGPEIVLSVSTALTTISGSPLVDDVTVRFFASAEAAPEVTDLVPRQGSTAGGQTVDILGENLGCITSVEIGGTAVANLPEPDCLSGASILTVEVPPGAPGLVDVVLTQEGGAVVHLPGGYLYVPPIEVASSIPRFLNPRGGSVLTIEGQGFTRPTTSALGGTRVLIRGIQATSVDVLSSTRLRATTPPGVFGDANVVVRSADGVEEEASPSPTGYGLSSTGSEVALSVKPVAVAVSPTAPTIVFAAPGASASGNRIDQIYTGVVVGAGTAPQSNRAAAFDVGTPRDPRLTGVATVSEDQAALDRLFGVLLGYLPEDTEVGRVELMPDALDVATIGNTLLVANGQSGLSVLDASTPNVLELQGTAQVDGGMVNRVIPRQTSAWVLSTTMEFDLSNANPCPAGGTRPAFSNASYATLVDVRTSTDPVAIAKIEPISEKALLGPSALVQVDGRLIVAEAMLQGVQYCPRGFEDLAAGVLVPPPPEFSLTGGGRNGQRTSFKDGQEPFGRVLLYDGVEPASGIAAEITFVDASPMDVAVRGGYLFVALAERGLHVYSIDELLEAEPPPGEQAAPAREILFDETLSNTPGEPLRLNIQGDVLFVAANEGGLYLLDISNPADPRFIAGGSTDKALDVARVGDRAMLAGHGQLTEIALPFTLALEAQPGRGELVGVDLERITVELTRAPFAPSVTASTVTLTGGAQTIDLDLELFVPGGAGNLGPERFQIVGHLEEPLAPDTEYTIYVSDQITDTRGGRVLLPFTSTFTTASAGSRTPRLSAVDPSFISQAATPGVIIQGSGLAGVNAVTVDGQPATVTAADDDTLTITTPEDLPRTGPVDLVVHDEHGPSATLESAFLVLADASEVAAAMSPDHGPVVGGTRVSITTTDAFFAPGSTFRVGGEVVTDPDVESLTTASFTVPPVDTPRRALVTMRWPGSVDDVEIGYYSYDLPEGGIVNLPGFPPRDPSEIAQSGKHIYVGVPTPGYEGVEVMDVLIRERPIRVGGVALGSPVHGLALAAGGNVLFAAADSAGLVTVSTQDPAAPYEVRRVGTSGPATDVVLANGVGYVATASKGSGGGYIQVFDPHQPQTPLVSSVGVAVDVLSLDVEVPADPPPPGMEWVRYLYAVTSEVGPTHASGLRFTIFNVGGGQVAEVVIDTVTRTFAAAVRSRIEVVGRRAFISVDNRIYVFAIPANLGAPGAGPPTLLLEKTLGEEVAVTGFSLVGGTLYATTTITGNKQSAAAAENPTLILLPASELYPVAVSPVLGETAATDATIVVTMSLPVDPLSVTTDSFRVYETPPGGSQTAKSGTRDVEFLIEGSRLHFTPDTPFTAGSTVMMVLEETVALGGVPQAWAHTSTFEVGEAGVAAPTISAVTPSWGYTSSVTALRIEGAGFAPDAVVSVGGELVLGSIVVDTLGTSIDVDVRSDEPGLATVRVSQGGMTASLPGAFLFREPVSLSFITPDRGPQKGGIVADLSGGGFLPGVDVSFGGTNSFEVVVHSTTRAEVLVPPGPPGLVDVEMAIDTESSTLEQAFLYGAGATSSLAGDPIRRVLASGSVLYALTGGTLTVQGPGGGGQATAPGTNLVIYDISEPGNLREAGRVQGLGSSPGGMVLDGELLYVAAGANGVRILDVGAAAAPTVTSTLPLPSATAVAISGDLLAIGHGSSVSTYRLHENAAPLLSRESDALDGPVSALAFHGGALLVGYESSTGGVLAALDARRPDLPSLSTLDLSAPPETIRLSGDRAFLPLGATGQVQIVDVTAPNQLAPVGTVVLTDPLGDTEPYAHDVKVSADVAWVATGSGKLQRFSVPVGAQPAFLQTATVFGDATGLAFAGNHLFAGVHYLDVGGVPVEMPISEAAQANGTLTGGLAAVRLDVLDVLGVSPPPSDPIGTSETVVVALTDYPNPSALAAAVSATGPSGGVDIDVTPRLTVEGGELLITPHTESVWPAGGSVEITLDESLADLLAQPLLAAVSVELDVGTVLNETRPRIASISPQAGIGGVNASLVTIFGEGLNQNVQVRIGGLPVDEILELSPAGDYLVVRPAELATVAGAAAVEVTTAGGLVDRRLGGYRFLTPPEITDFNPKNIAFNSGAEITVSGEGLFAGSVVSVEGVPAPEVRLNANGTLTFVAPDNIIGPASITVTTPGDDSQLQATAEPLNYMMRSIGTIAMEAAVLEVKERALFVGNASGLHVFDISNPSSPAWLATRDGPPEAEAISRLGDDLYLAGAGEVVRYDITGCGVAAGAGCSADRMESVEILPAGVSITAVSAHEDSALIAVGGANEIAVLGLVNGSLEILNQILLATGDVEDLAAVDDDVVVLVKDDNSQELFIELRELGDASLAPLWPSPSPPYDATTTVGPGLAVHGRHVAFSARDGVHVLDARDTGATEIAFWSRTDSPALELAMVGPWVAAGRSGRLSLVDLTPEGGAATERTFALPTGVFRDVVFGPGSVIAAHGSSIDLYEVVHPVPFLFSPAPGLALKQSSSVEVTYPVSHTDRVQHTALAAALDAVTYGPSSGVLPDHIVRLAAPAQGWPLSAPPPELTVTLSLPSPANAVGPLGAWASDDWSFALPIVVDPSEDFKIDTVSPSLGPLVGGTLVDLNGPGLHLAETVTFGSSGPVTPDTSVAIGRLSSRLRRCTPVR